MSTNRSERDIRDELLDNLETRWQFNDGGRAAAGFKGSTGDCVTRAIAIATGKPYREVYETLWGGLREYAATHRDKTAARIRRGRGRRGTTPRNGMWKVVYRPYLESLGWQWIPTMGIGQGCKVHLRAEELPLGRLIVKLSKHLVAVINGVIHDTYDPSRGGTRCVYGYFRQAARGTEGAVHRFAATPIISITP